MKLTKAQKSAAAKQGWARMPKATRIATLTKLWSAQVIARHEQCLDRWLTMAIEQGRVREAILEAKSYGYSAGYLARRRHEQRTRKGQAA